MRRNAPYRGRTSDPFFDLYIGPKAPAGKEANWIASVPGKGWFALFRVYGPTEAWYDEKMWRVGEIEWPPVTKHG